MMCCITSSHFPHTTQENILGILWYTKTEKCLVPLFVFTRLKYLVHTYVLQYNIHLCFSVFLKEEKCNEKKFNVCIFTGLYVA